MKTENVFRLADLANELEMKEINRSDLAAELKAMFIIETGENPWAKPVEDMSPEHLDSLSDTYLGEGDQFANFYTFWGNYLACEPEPDEMTRLLQQISEWGYILDDNSELAD